MHLIITDPWFAKQRAVHVSGLQLLAVGAAAVLVVILASLVTYHLVFVHGVRQGWPVATTLANLLSNAERQSQERYLRENLDAMATRLGEMQARVVQLDALAERLAVLAGLPALDAKSRGGAGGVLVKPQDLTMVELSAHIEDLSRQSDVSHDRLAAVEGQFFLDRVRKAMLPTASPVRMPVLALVLAGALTP